MTLRTILRRMFGRNDTPSTSGLRCKPGDLCRIVSNGPLRDHFITVTEFEDRGYGIEWAYEPPLLEVVIDGKVCDQVTLFDRVLRPIRDPGPFATDETLVFAGKPQSREVA